MKTEAIFDNIANRIEEQINLAEDKIFIAVAWFTNKNLFKALCKKASEGVKVKLVISDNEINRNSTINHSDIQIGKSKLYWIETHNKFCIIDDYVVITGSYNWSYKAENNLENIIICSGDNDLVKQFKKELKRIIKDYPQEDGIRPLLKRTEAEKSGNVKTCIPSSKFREYVTPPAIPSIKNDFESIKIGEQEWMLKNLDVDRFRNGDLIPHIKDEEEWIEAGRNRQPAWCYYDNNPTNEKLYNWNSVIDLRAIAPPGWRVPSNADWQILIDYLGGDDHYFLDKGVIAGSKILSMGFLNFPGFYFGSFSGINKEFHYWADIERYNSGGFYNESQVFSLYKDGNNNCCLHPPWRNEGASIRCLKV